MEFDKAHIIRSREDFIDKTAYVRDSLSIPDVDLGEYSVIAVTGLAASVVDTIIPVYGVCQGEYVFDLDIKPTTMRAAYKWNLMLKIPKIDDSVRAECRK